MARRLGATTREGTFLRAGTLLIVAGLAAACGDFGKSSSPAAATKGGRRGGPIPVEVTTVEARDLAYVVQGTGALEAYQIVVVSARVEGQVEDIAFEEGDAVTTDRPLAVVDGARRALAVAEAQASLDRSTASLGRVVAQEEKARTDLAEAEALLARRREMRAKDPGLFPAEEIETRAAEVARRRADVGVAEAARKETTAAGAESRARLAIAEKERDDATVRSPIAGVVRRRHATPGQYLRAGDAVAELVDRSRLRLRFRVSEAESVRVAREMPVSFRVPSLPGRTFPARILHVDETANPTTRMVEVLSDVGAPDPALKPGFFVIASVTTLSARAIAVPEDALQPTEQGWAVYVVVDGKARRRLVAVGLRTPEGLVEVREGLAAGDALVVRGANVLDEGLPVSVRQPGASTPTPVPAPGTIPAPAAKDGGKGGSSPVVPPAPSEGGTK